MVLLFHIAVLRLLYYVMHNTYGVDWHCSIINNHTLHH